MPEPLPEPSAELLRRAHALSGEMDVEAAGFSLCVKITPVALRNAYLPVLELLLRAGADERRVLAGLAGIPGGGKSTFAAALQRVADEVIGPGALVVVGIDGWHLPNHVLDARTTRGADGSLVPLRQRKGGPESYDVVALLDSLKTLRAATGEVRLPAYDRRLHEPRADAITIPGTARFIILEGNYVLGGVGDVPAWDDVSAMLAPTFFLACDRDLARRRVIERHIRGGLPNEAARVKHDRNDRLNTDIVLSTAERATWVISEAD